MIKKTPHLILYFLLQLICTAASAQYLKSVWVNDIGNYGDTKATNIAADNQGNIYVSGFIIGNAVFTLENGTTKQLTSHGNADVFIAKYNAQSNKCLWATSFGGYSIDVPNSMAVDKDGNLLITGQFQDDVNFNPAGNATMHASADGLFFAKYNGTDGSYMWAKSIDGYNAERGQSIIADNDNNIILSGSYTDDVDADPGPDEHRLPNTGGFLKGFFAKYDTNGNFIWAHSLGNFTNTNLTGVTVDQQTNDIIVNGDFSGTVDFSYTGNPAAIFSSYQIAGFVARYTASGNYKWVRYLPGSGTSLLTSVKTDGQGNIIVAGNFGGSFYPNGPSGTPLMAVGSSDLLVASYASDGTLNWAKSFGGASTSVSGRYVTTDQDNNIYATGYFNNTLTISTTLPYGILKTNGGSGFFVAGFSASGIPLVAGAVGTGCANTVAYEMAAINNKLYVAGTFCNTQDFDMGQCNQNIQARTGNADAFLAAYTLAQDEQTTITNFTIAQQAEPAVIDQTNHTITVMANEGADLTHMAPSITLDGGTVSPASGSSQNFSGGPVNYVATSNSCFPTTYKVTVKTVQPENISACISVSNLLLPGKVITAGSVYNWQRFDGSAWTSVNISTPDYLITPPSAQPGIIQNLAYRCKVTTNGTDIYSPYYDVSFYPRISNSMIAADRAYICLDDNAPIALNGNVPDGAASGQIFNYQWQQSYNQTAWTDIANATQQNYQYPSAVRNNIYFRRKVSAGGCDDYSNIIGITYVLPITVAYAGADQSICTGSSAIISANAPASDETGSWSVLSPSNYNPFTAASINKQEVTLSDLPHDADVMLKWTIAKKFCSQTSTSTVILHASSTPIVNAGTQTAITGGDQIILNGNVTGPQDYTVTWSPDYGLDDVHLLKPTASPAKTTVYTLTAVSAAGCTSSATVEILVTPNLIIPNTFTPNGDGVNDIWNIKNIAGYSEATVTVFNRYGQQVFESKGYAVPWNGTAAGIKIPAGVYYYIINLNDIHYKKTGYVSVLY